MSDGVAPAAERLQARSAPASPVDAAPTAIRVRLVRWMLVAVGVAVLLLGIPLAVVARQWVYAQEIGEVQRRTEQVASLLDDRRSPEWLPTVVATSAEVLDARVTVLNSRLQVVRDSGGVAPGTVFDDEPVRRVLPGARDGERLGDNLVVAVVTQLDGAPVIVRVAAPADTAEARVRSVLLAIVVLGGASLAVAAALGSWRARQLAMPLEAVADAARRLGEGDFGSQAPRSDIAEIDRIAASLDVTAARLRTALERSASLSADASHQLRTPLTALRLNLEALAAELAAPSGLLEAADAEVDRLETTIEELLALTDAAVRPHDVDLRELVLARLDAWRTLADAAGRAVRVTRAAVPPVRARPAAIGQALQVLLDNAVIHGSGDVTVWLEPVHRGGRTWVRVCVGDEGPGPTVADVAGDEGRGLPLARALIEAEGGRLVHDANAGNRVCLLVPAVEDADASADPPPPDAAPATGGPVDDGGPPAVDDARS